MAEIEALKARIAALEARLLVLEANPYRLYPTFPAPYQAPWSPPWTITCGALHG